MPNNVDGVTLDIVKNIQASTCKLTERFDHLETVLRKDRRNVAGMLVMMRATAGDFDERVTEIEERVAAWKPRRISARWLQAPIPTENVDGRHDDEFRSVEQGRASHGGAWPRHPCGR